MKTHQIKKIKNIKNKFYMLIFPPMILYALISGEKQGEILADYPKNAKALSDLVKGTLEKIPTNVEHKHTYEQENYNFNYKCNGHFVYYCLTAQDFPLRVTFAFLDDLEANHLRTRTNKNTNLNNLIKDKMAHFNNLDNDQISKLKKKVDDTKSVMLENIDKIVDRGTDLDELVKQTDSLSVKSKQFSKGAKDLRFVLFLFLKKK
jgi:AAA15 family ATPase/GTPase